MKRNPRNPKTPKTPKTPATRKPGLPRSEWDFAKVPRAAAGAVCMREYAKECLRVWNNNGFAEFLGPMATSMAEAFRVAGTAIDAAALVENVRAGLRRRRAIPDKSPTPGPALVALDVARVAWETARTGRANLHAPPGAQFAFFAINWRASNNEIKRAFGEWLKTQNRGRLRPAQWLGALEGTFSSILGTDAAGLPHDYIDAAAALQDVLDDEAIPTDGTPPQGAALIAAQRVMRGGRKGRGDSKQALLTDLAIYRLHNAGCKGQKIARLLGSARLKFYDAPLIARAIKNAEARLKETLLSAFICEGWAFRLQDMARAHPTGFWFREWETHTREKT